jgi:hypothetical protein
MLATETDRKHFNARLHFRLLTAETLSRYQADIMPIGYPPLSQLRGPSVFTGDVRFKPVASDAGFELLTAVKT